MAEIIVIAGAPGSGKHTIIPLLRDRLHWPPYIDFGRVRQFHLDREWKLANEQEEAMAFKNVVFMTNNYLKHGYSNVIVTDLLDFRVREIPNVFSKSDFIILTLVLHNQDQLRKRIEARSVGFRNVNAALLWNDGLINRLPVINEIKIENSHDDPQLTAELIIKHIEGKHNQTVDDN